jgi:hypothetical protein
LKNSLVETNILQQHNKVSFGRTFILQSNIRVTVNAKKGENTQFMCMSREYCDVHSTLVGNLILNTEAVVMKIP